MCSGPCLRSDTYLGMKFLAWDWALEAVEYLLPSGTPGIQEISCRHGVFIGASKPGRRRGGWSSRINPPLGVACIHPGTIWAARMEAERIKSTAQSYNALRPPGLI